MPSRRNLKAHLLLALGLSVATAAWPQTSEPPTREQVRQAVEKVKQDANLNRTHRQKFLRLKERQPETPKPADRAAQWDWLRQWFSWVAEAGRVLMWALGVVAVAVLLVSLRHWMRLRSGDAGAVAAQPPTHVGELDIRRESLPADIGATARVLWDRGQAREALSLLYRGALSRLVYLHAVPIAAASTEDECVRLATRVLTQPDRDFLARLVQLWQVAVYGQKRPGDADVWAVCEGFDAHLSPPASAALPARGAAA